MQSCCYKMRRIHKYMKTKNVFHRTDRPCIAYITCSIIIIQQLAIKSHVINAANKIFSFVSTKAWQCRRVQSSNKSPCWIQDKQCVFCAEMFWKMLSKNNYDQRKMPFKVLGRTGKKECATLYLSRNSHRHHCPRITWHVFSLAPRLYCATDHCPRSHQSAVLLQKTGCWVQVCTSQSAHSPHPRQYHMVTPNQGAHRWKLRPL